MTAKLLGAMLWEGREGPVGAEANERRRTVELDSAVLGLAAQVLAEHQIEQQRRRAQRAVRVEATLLLHECVHLGRARPTVCEQGLHAIAKAGPRNPTATALAVAL